MPNKILLQKMREIKEKKLLISSSLRMIKAWFWFSSFLFPPSPPHFLLFSTLLLLLLLITSEEQEGEWDWTLCFVLERASLLSPSLNCTICKPRISEPKF